MSNLDKLRELTEKLSDVDDTTEENYTQDFIDGLAEQIEKLKELQLSAQN